MCYFKCLAYQNDNTLNLVLCQTRIFLLNLIVPLSPELGNKHLTVSSWSETGLFRRNRVALYFKFCSRNVFLLSSTFLFCWYFFEESSALVMII